MGSCTNQSCPRDENWPFEPSSSPVGHSQVSPDPPWPQDGAAGLPWLGLLGFVALFRVIGSCTNQSCPGDENWPFEPSSSLLGHSQVATDPPWPQDGAAGLPWLGLLGLVALIRVMGSWTNQSYPGDEHWPFEPSSSLLGHSKVAPDPPWPQDGTARLPWLGLLGLVALIRVIGSWTNQSCPRDEYWPFEPSSSPLGHSQVSPDPPWPQDGAARQPWLGLLGHAPAKAVAVESTLSNIGILSRNIPAQCDRHVHWWTGCSSLSLFLLLPCARALLCTAV